MKNKLLLFLVKIFSFWIKKNPLANRILVISTTALGDSLWATPSLESLRKSYPNAYIGLLTSPVGEQVLRHNPWVDQTWVLKEPLSLQFLSLWKKLRKEQFDTILILHASQRLILPLAALLGASKVIATAKINKGLDVLLSESIAPQKEHEIVRRLRLLEALGGARHTETLSFFLQQTEEHPPLPKGTWIGLHPGSKDAFKRWPSSHFVELGKKLQEQGFHILVTGGKDEQDLVQEVAQAIPGAIQSNPALSIRQLGGLLKHLNLLISNDTGPFHLACALGVRAIGLYASTDPSLCGPHQATSGLAISRPPTCVPCMKRACHRPFCMLQIGPQEVLRTALKVLS